MTQTRIETPEDLKSPYPIMPKETDFACIETERTSNDTLYLKDKKGSWTKHVRARKTGDVDSYALVKVPNTVQQTWERWNEYGEQDRQLA